MLPLLEPDAVWTQDAAHLAGRGREASWGRVVVDRCTREHLSLSVSGAPRSAESVAQLERVRVQEGRLPLVLMADNGGENRGELVAWAREHQVVLLYNQPRTPQHNGAGERAIGGLREELVAVEEEQQRARGRRVASHGRIELPDAADTPAREGLRERLARAWWRLDHLRPRPCLGGRTAAEVAQIAGRAYDRVCRARFYSACCRAVDDAVQGVLGKRARRRAEREATWRTLEEHGLVIRRRGKAPWPSPKADITHTSMLPSWK